MKIKILLVNYLLTISYIIAQNPTFKVFSVAFYNLENLFDTENNPDTFDDAYTPKGSYHWTGKKLATKIDNLALAISKIGYNELGHPPNFLGVAEVENIGVLELLIDHPLLKPFDYGISHFNSKDRRGIDVAFLYRRNQFSLINEQKHFLTLTDEAGQPILTRDQLCVSGILDGEPLYFIINHWPSRRGGAKRSAPKRILAAELTKKITDSIYKIHAEANIIVMGDFNDNPTNISIKKVLNAKASIRKTNSDELFNPYEFHYKKGSGSLGFRDKWYLFDQILVSSSLTDTIGWQYLKSNIFNPLFLQNKKGKYKGYPNRSAGNKFGFSDHFPVYMLLGKKVKY